MRSPAIPRLRVTGALLLAAAAAVSAGCGEGFEKVVERHRAAMEAKALAAVKVGEAARARPRLERDGLSAPVPLRLHLAQTHLADSNALAVYWEDLVLPEELGYVVARVEGTRRFADCVSYVRRGHTAFDPAQPSRFLAIPLGFTASDALTECTRVRYLVVLRTVGFVPPGTAVHAPVQSFVASGADAGVVDAGAPAPPAEAGAADAGAPEDTWSFEGGQIELEVLVYELEGARDLGGFRVSAENSPVFDGTDVEQDLRNNLGKALEQGLGAHVPGALGGG